MLLFLTIRIQNYCPKFSWFLRINQITNVIHGWSSWKASSVSDSWEIPSILWNQKVHHHVHKSPPHFLALSQIVPVHVPSSYFLETHFNILIPSMPGSSQVFSFPYMKPVFTSCFLHVYYMSGLSHSTWIMFGEQYKLWRPSLCSFLQSSSLLGPNVFVSTLFLKHHKSVFLP